jgi:hypothetical protein
VHWRDVLPRLNRGAEELDHVVKWHLARVPECYDEIRVDHLLLKSKVRFIAGWCGQKEGVDDLLCLLLEWHQASVVSIIVLEPPLPTLKRVQHRSRRLPTSQIEGTQPLVAGECVNKEIEHREWRRQGWALRPPCLWAVVADAFVPSVDAAEVSLQETRDLIVFPFRTGQLKPTQRPGDCALSAVSRAFIHPRHILRVPVREQTAVDCQAK